MKISLLVTTLALVAGLPLSASAALECQADFSIFRPGAVVNVHLDHADQPTVSGYVKVGDKTFDVKNAPVLEYPVRHNVDYASAESTELNPGELRVFLYATYLQDPDLKAAMRLKTTFKIQDIATVRIYDLREDATYGEMGGSPLVEFRDSNGRVLARFMQIVALSPCRS